jgi:hypothetical protein
MSFPERVLRIQRSVYFLLRVLIPRASFPCGVLGPLRCPSD